MCIIMFFFVRSTPEAHEGPTSAASFSTYTKQDALFFDWPLSREGSIVLCRFAWYSFFFNPIFCLCADVNSVMTPSAWLTGGAMMTYAMFLHGSLPLKHRQRTKIMSPWYRCLPELTFDSTMTMLPYHSNGNHWSLIVVLNEVHSTISSRFNLK